MLVDRRMQLGPSMHGATGRIVDVIQVGAYIFARYGVVIAAVHHLGIQVVGVVELGSVVRAWIIYIAQAARVQVGFGR